MQTASSITTLVVHPPVPESEAPRAAEQSATFAVGPADTAATSAVSLDEAIVCLEHCSAKLAHLLPSHRRATLESVASGTLTANDAIAHVEMVRFLDRLAHHAWRASAHVAGAIVQY